MVKSVDRCKVLNIVDTLLLLENWIPLRSPTDVRKDKRAGPINFHVKHLSNGCDTATVLIILKDINGI